MLNILLWLWLSTISMYAGESLVCTPGMAATTLVDPWVDNNQSYRIEFRLHNFALTGWDNVLVRLYGTGFNSKIRPDNLLSLGTLRDTVASADFRYLDLTGRSDIVVRYQRDVAGMRVSAEMWNVDGTGYYGTTDTITVINNYPNFWNGGDIGAGADGVNTSIAFVKVFHTIVPLRSKQPRTADNGDWTELKYDNSLIDSTGNGHNTVQVGPSYIATPVAYPIGVIKTANATEWSNWVSLRAGFTNSINGTDSVSMADANDTISYKWRLVQGASELIWDSLTSEIVNILGAVFGQYTIALTVTDTTGLATTATLDIGAVAMDDNGVVIPSDSKVTKIFNEMIAFGKNPWGFTDERALAATTLRKAKYEEIQADGYSLANPAWLHNGAGTVSYTFGGIGAAPGAAGTALCAPLGIADMTVEVCDTSKLDLTGLPGVPVRILVGGGWLSANSEEIEICSVAGNILTVCYNGRGKSVGIGSLVAAKAHVISSIVGQYRFNGTGSKFITDTQVPFCPTGIGPFGRESYSTGNVTLTAGSGNIVGIGTKFAASMVGSQIKVTATHGATPFIYTAIITTVTDVTNIVVNTVFPIDADTGDYAFQVLPIRYPVLYYTRNSVVDTTSEGRMYAYGTWCASDTVAYGQPRADYSYLQGIITATTFVNKNWTMLDIAGVGYQSAFGPNFYGEGLAHRVLYYRSGLTAALTAANEIDETWTKSPEIDGGYAGGIALLLGGGANSTFANLVLNTSTTLTWKDVYGFVLKAQNISANGCDFYDSRDSGYMYAWLTFAALYDPNAVNRAVWKTKLQNAYTTVNTCKRNNPANPVETNSWAGGGSRWNYGGAKMNVTNGSAVVTANVAGSFAAQLNGGYGGCHGIAIVTVTMVNGSANFTGVGLVNGGKITINGTKDGAEYTGIFQYTQVGGVTGTLAALWPGDSGTVSAMISDNVYGWDNNMVISKCDTDGCREGSADVSMKQNWECRYDNPNQITLNRPWSLGTDLTGKYNQYRYLLAGYGQQPYMLGIQTQFMHWASQIDDTEAAGFAGLANAAANWIREWGFDPNTQGLNYGRVFGACEPSTTATPGSTYYYRTPNCNYGLGVLTGIATARPLNGEVGATIGIVYKNTPSVANKTYGDLLYGSLWGKPEWTTGGVYSDPYWVKSETSNISLGNTKWTGFFFGMGMAHQWPAIRLGGVSPLVSGSTYIGYDLSEVIGAVETRVTVTSPNGKIDVYVCGTPCEITVDRRQGMVWARMEYLDGGGGVLAQGNILVDPGVR